MHASAADPRLSSLRSFLFAPASHARRAGRALASSAHAAVLDLEDAVTAGEKDGARALAERLLREPAAGPARLIRINAVETPFFADDLALLARVAVDAVVLPKASPAALELLPQRFPPVYALVESAAGLRDAFALASSPRVAGLMLGAVDLAADLGLEPRPDGAELLLARSQLVRDSRAAGALAPVDGVWTRLDDPAGLARDAALARSLGLRGKLCVHPGQLDAVNAAFAPDDERRRRAQRVLDAFEAAAARGEGAVEVDGEMVDLAVAECAQRVLRDGGAA
jgi:citrate lyase beta subunit